jgi:1-aminocyclopropane-1-carboxylate deaminase/D-cysteine desulfhydrase-like pyridoxal-dependent ACC family enzyme
MGEAMSGNDGSGSRESRPAARDGLRGLPKVDVGVGETPLEAKPALAAGLGLSCPLYVKRDDLAGPGMGGNKARKLQYVIADALQRGADCLITVGAVQSNHARLTAVCGAMAGLEVHLVLGGDPEEMRGGNLVLDRLAAAQLHFVAEDDWELLATTSEQLADELRAQGKRPYVIPVGASVPLGAVGYAEAYLELLGQLDAAGVAADWLVTASGSGGTQGGLLAGRALADRGPRVIGVDVAKGGADLRESITSLADGCLELLGRDARVPPGHVLLVDGAGPGYGQVFDKNREAILTALRTAGLLLDPVYTSKAMAAVPDLVAGGLIAPHEPLVFLHTGGLPALFAPAYEAACAEGGGGGRPSRRSAA